jgi:hypothetical protein
MVAVALACAAQPLQISHAFQILQHLLQKVLGYAQFKGQFRVAVNATCCDAFQYLFQHVNLVWISPGSVLVPGRTVGQPYYIRNEAIVYTTPPTTNETMNRKARFRKVHFHPASCRMAAIVAMQGTNNI